MPKHSLTKKNEAYLTVEIDGKEYNIPLAKTMKVKEVKQILKIKNLKDSEAFEFMCEFLSRYMGEDLVDNMTTGDITEVFDLWKKANDEVEGVTLGESSASPDSATSTARP